MIVLAATPIGNLGDASTRLVELLNTATVIAAEDTRVTIKLMRALGVENRPRLVALHDHNERAISAELVEQARDEDIVVLSDAGMPTVSDPGFHLVEAAIAAGVGVTVVPGPSAVITALALSGLPSDRFTFEGFAPRKHGDRLRWFRALAREERTMIFFESPNRIADSLADCATAFGADRRAAVCRELTKLFEEARRGTLGELVEWAQQGVRGEIVVVVHGASIQQLTLEQGVEQLAELVAQGMRLKEAANEIAEATGLSKRELYEAGIKAKQKS